MQLTETMSFIKTKEKQRRCATTYEVADLNLFNKYPVQILCLIILKKICLIQMLARVWLSLYECDTDGRYNIQLLQYDGKA